MHKGNVYFLKMRFVRFVKKILKTTIHSKKNTSRLIFGIIFQYRVVNMGVQLTNFQFVI